MPLHITDPKAEKAIRELAKRRGLTLTRAVEAAAEEALLRDSSATMEQAASIHEIQSRIAAYPRRREALPTHKDFFDSINEET